MIRTTWRKKKRKKLCIEKILSDPPRQQSSENNEEDIEDIEGIELVENKEVELQDSKGVELKVIKEGDFKDNNIEEFPVQEMELLTREVDIVPKDSSKVKSCIPAVYLPVNRTPEIQVIVQRVILHNCFLCIFNRRVVYLYRYYQRNII